MPPDRLRDCPVRYEDTSEARNSAVLTMSSTLAMRPSGMFPDGLAQGFSAEPPDVPIPPPGNPPSRSRRGRDKCCWPVCRRHRHGLQEHDQPRLADGIAAVPGRGRLPAPDGDHGPTACPHEQERVQQAERAVHVDVLRAQPRFNGVFRQLHGIREDYALDQDIDARKQAPDRIPRIARPARRSIRPP